MEKEVEKVKARSTFISCSTGEVCSQAPKFPYLVAESGEENTTCCQGRELRTI